MNGEIAVNRQKSLDDLLLELASAELSPEEISRRIGGALNPAQVRIKIDTLTKAGNWLTDVQKERALIAVLHQNLRDMRDVPLTLDGAKLQLSYIETLLKRLDRRQEVTANQLETYNSSVGRALGQAVVLALTYMKAALREEVDPEKWDALVVEAMGDARRQLAEKVVDD